ncbi:MAG: hypothetical protein GTO41_19930 [Burkholderiales bacterium]|nr:hypothetical protein [Burkholderiales bacterium]
MNTLGSKKISRLSDQMGRYGARRNLMAALAHLICAFVAAALNMIAPTILGEVLKPGWWPIFYLVDVFGAMVTLCWR